MAEYNRVTLAEADHAARFIAGCYAAFPRFSTFTDYAMFYFAAASFAEMSRRLGGERHTPALSGEFLRVNDPAFAEAMTRLSPAAQVRLKADATKPPEASYPTQVASAIAHVNIAGLSDPAKRNWYDVDLRDAIAGAERLGVREAAVRELILRQGLGVPPG